MTTFIPWGRLMLEPIEERRRHAYVHIAPQVDGAGDSRR